MVEKQTRTWLFLALLIALLFGLDVLAMHTVFTSQRSGSNDFYPRWRGAQLFYREGVDPYTETATQEIQRGIRGRLSRPDEDQLAFAYPFYTSLLLIPLLWLSYDWVEAIWLVVIQFSLIAGVLVYLPLLRWRLAPMTLAATVLWAVIVYHGARTILLGQFAGLIFFGTALLLWALSRGRDVAAGILLALITIKPQMSVLLIPALLWWGVGRQRWRFLASAAATMFLLLAISFLLLPNWLGSFVEQVLRYPSYTAYGNPLTVLTGHYLPRLGAAPAVGRLLAPGLAVLLLAYLFWQWRHLAETSASEARFHYLIGLTLIVTNLIVPRTATTNYVVLYMPLFLLFRQLLAERTGASGWLLLFYLGSIVGLWILFIRTVQGDFESPVMFLPLPLSLLFLFVYMPDTLRKPFNDSYEVALNVLSH